MRWVLCGGFGTRDDYGVSYSGISPRPTASDMGHPDYGEERLETVTWMGSARVTR